MPILIFIIWLGSAILLGMTANGNGRSFLVWFIIGMVTSPLASWLIFLVVVKGR